MTIATACSVCGVPVQQAGLLSCGRLWLCRICWELEDEFDPKTAHSRWWKAKRIGDDTEARYWARRLIVVELMQAMPPRKVSP